MPRTPVCSFSKLVVFAALLAVTASAQTRNRIVQRIEDTEPAVVGEAHPMARLEFDQGRVDGSMKISRAALVFKLAPAQQAALEKLLAEQQDPHSANYRKWLTPEQYAARFGMSADDLARVAAWLKSQGLTVDGFSRGRTEVFFSGSAAQVEGVFHTEFHRYLVNGETHFANATELSVPAAFSNMVQGFRGLDNFRPRPRVVARPNFTSHVSGNHYIAPGDFATIYDLSPLYAAGLDGSGETIAVAGQTLIAANNSTTDLDAFRAASGLPAKDPQFLLVPGTGTGVILSSGDQTEADLDLEWSGAVAKNASIIFVFVGNAANKSVWDALQYAIDQNLAPVVSTSYGFCEGGEPAGFPQVVQGWVQQANSQGQTVIAASGDSGAADCEAASATTAILGLAVDLPASIPEVTGIGGTEFNGDAAGVLTGTAPNTNAGATTYWSGTSNFTDTISSAISYIPEMGWNDTAVSIAAGGGISAGGGGASTVFAKPTWQTALTPADTHRDVPDLALTGSPNHDGLLVCTQGSCVTGFRAGDGSLSVVGGTSVGAPTFAGIVAIIKQAAPSTPGNINQTLYTLAASTPSAFHDITTGNNIVPCTAGTPTSGAAAIRCPTTAPFQFGYSAGAGYDQVTGLGSVDANVLVTSWPGFVSTPDFTIAATAPSPGTISAGGSATSTITVTARNGFTGTVSLSCSVTGGGSPAPTCSLLPTPVASGPSVSTLTIATTAATPAGTYGVTVTGTSGSLTHTDSVSIIVGSTTPDFTIAATAPSPATVSAGASATSTITIAPTNGFSATVNLSCSVTGGGTPAPTCALAPGSVSNGTGTSTLTVSTTAPRSLSVALIPPQPVRGFGWLAASGSGLLAGIFVLGVPRRRRHRMAGLGLMLLVFFAAGLGCGGGSSSNSTSSTSPGTPAGSYTVTVTATSGSISHPVAVIVTVQ